MSDALSPHRSARHLEDGGDSSPDSEEYFPSHSLSRPGILDKTPHSASGIAPGRKRRSANASSWKKRQKNRRSTAARSEEEDSDEDDDDGMEDSMPDEDD